MLPKVQCEFQIAKPNRLIRQVIDYCTLFWWFAAKATAPLMAALPSDRLFQPAFACTGIDYFSPIEVKIFQRVVKRRGCLFTCLTCAVHSKWSSLSTRTRSSPFFFYFKVARDTHKYVHSNNGTIFFPRTGHRSTYW
jgi:hypothetical protein